MIDPYLTLSQMTEGWLQPNGCTPEEEEEASGLQAGAYDAWPWRPATQQWPRQRTPDCGMPPPCPMHAQSSQVAPPVYTGRPPRGWTHTV